MQYIMTHFAMVAQAYLNFMSCIAAYWKIKSIHIIYNVDTYFQSSSGALLEILNNNSNLTPYFEKPQRCFIPLYESMVNTLFV